VKSACRCGEHEIPSIIDPKRDQSFESERALAGSLGQLFLCSQAFDGETDHAANDQEWIPTQSQPLLRWAGQRGRIISPVEFRLLLGACKSLPGGGEHNVFYNRGEDRVIKVTRPPYFGQDWYLSGYLRNLIWNNVVFQDDFRLEGVVSLSDGVSLVISQPYIHGHRPTLDQVRSWFDLQACEQLGPYRWRFPDGTAVKDAHEGNFILHHRGLVPIDLFIDRLSTQLAGEWDEALIAHELDFPPDESP
jgi:Serine/Threonine/Tyrosine Kinase found in polyvalent proteins